MADPTPRYTVRMDAGGHVGRALLVAWVKDNDHPNGATGDGLVSWHRTVADAERIAAALNRDELRTIADAEAGR